MLYDLLIDIWLIAYCVLALDLSNGTQTLEIKPIRSTAKKVRTAINIGRLAVYYTEGCRFDPGSGHAKFLFLQREFT